MYMGNEFGRTFHKWKYAIFMGRMKNEVSLFLWDGWSIRKPAEYSPTLSHMCSPRHTFEHLKLHLLVQVTIFLKQSSLDQLLHSSSNLLSCKTGFMKSIIQTMYNLQPRRTKSEHHNFLLVLLIGI